MILTVTLNPALDVTYLVESLARRAATRVRQVTRRAGGKGVNVARVAARCGAAVCATGLAGGLSGQVLREAVAADGIADEFEPIAGETRQTLTIVETASASPTELREPGPAVTGSEWSSFLARYARLAAGASVVVLSGSLPPGVPDDAYATLTRLVRGGPLVVVDAGGQALRLACAAGPDLVKPNHGELLEAAGGEPGPEPEPGPPGTARVVAAAGALRDLGAQAVVASLGRTGSVAVTPGGRWRVSHPRVDGNPVGAGDALVAGLALGLASGAEPSVPSSWPDLLRRATGLAMASVLSPAAGMADPGEASDFAGNVRIQVI